MSTSTIEPLRMSLKDAAALMALDVGTVRNLVYDDVFTVIAPFGRKKGRRIYLVPAEVRAYATGGAKAVAALRKKGRAK